MTKGGEFNKLNFVVENFPFNGIFIIEGFYFNKTFLLKNVLIILDGFILIKESKVLLDTNMWVGCRPGPSLRPLKPWLEAPNFGKASKS